MIYIFSHFRSSVDGPRCRASADRGPTLRKPFETFFLFTGIFPLIPLFRSFSLHCMSKITFAELLAVRRQFSKTNAP